MTENGGASPLSELIGPGTVVQGMFQQPREPREL